MLGPMRKNEGEAIEIRQKELDQRAYPFYC